MLKSVHCRHGFGLRSTLSWTLRSWVGWLSATSYIAHIALSFEQVHEFKSMGATGAAQDLPDTSYVFSKRQNIQFLTEIKASLTGGLGNTTPVEESFRCNLEKSRAEE
jgi:hypothetical protein